MVFVKIISKLLSCFPLFTDAHAHTVDSICNTFHMYSYMCTISCESVRENKIKFLLALLWICVYLWTEL